MIYLFYFMILILCFLLTCFYINFAKKNKIVARGEKNNLHKGTVPRGAGIIFGLAYIIMLSTAFYQNHINLNIYLPIIFASTSCLTLGFFDDILDLNASTKFFFSIYNSFNSNIIFF